MGMLKDLKTLLDEPTVRSLRAGDVVYFTGEIFTMRDQAHLRALKLLDGRGLPFDLEGRVIYHCGPLVKGGRVVSAGPTTSMRMERMESDLIRRSGVRAVIGKGGMGERTLSALQDCGCAYLEYTGGAGALAAKSAKGIRQVFWQDLGEPEAVWVIEVEKFGPCFVTMDSHGGELRKGAFRP
ncbi:MAG: FumA C-terminus/TtdB family hydratase beta subunit [Candidatus Methanomethylicia archaeon]|nr:FumA C-terminus/TtdB family hydratase beta subunit [Candidatus Methanomethylicia archaeon]